MLTMTEKEYKQHREEWAMSIAAIRYPKFFPRCMKYRLRQIARLDAQYLGELEEECFKRLLVQAGIKYEQSV